MQPTAIRATSGHRDGQIGLATERTTSGYMIRFYSVYSPRLTDETAILQSLRKGHGASIAVLDESEFQFIKEN